MSLKISTLKPGLLVSLKTSIRGNTQYQRVDIEPDHQTETGERRAVWETRRTISDPEEHESAIKVRGKCRSLISGLCANSAFGLLCPEAKAADLESVIAESRKLAESFNQSAKLSRIDVYVIAGRVASDDVEAVRAINSEMRDLVGDMESGIKSLDVESIREAANKARSVSQMLTPESAETVQKAIEAARSIARKIVKAGEAAATEVDRQTLATLAAARTAFIDLDPQGDIAEPVGEGRALDLAPVAPISEPAPASISVELD